MADVGDLAGYDEGEAAKRVHVFIHFGQLWINLFGQIVQLCACVRFPNIGGHLGEWEFGLVIMFVFDFADDFFDQILNRYQALGPRIFIQYNRQMRACAPHFIQQRKYAHILRHKTRLANEGFKAVRGFLI